MTVFIKEGKLTTALMILMVDAIFIAFYHEIKLITKGYRLCLITYTAFLVSRHIVYAFLKKLEKTLSIQRKELP